MLRLIIGFLPWIIFGVLGKRHFLLALILALAVSAVTAVRRAGHAAECWLTSATLIRGPSSCHDGTWTGSRKLGPGRGSLDRVAEAMWLAGNAYRIMPAEPPPGSWSPCELRTGRRIRDAVASITAASSTGGVSHLTARAARLVAVGLINASHQIRAAGPMNGAEIEPGFRRSNQYLVKSTPIPTPQAFK